MQNLLNIKNFDIDELTKIYDSSKTYTEGKLLKKELDNCKIYIQNTIFNLDDGKSKMIFVNDDIKVMDKDQFNDIIFNRFPCKELKEWFKSSPEIKFFKLSSEKSDCVIDFKKKKIFNSPKIKATYSKYETFSKDTKDACNLMLNHIKEINCGGDKVQYEYLLKLLKRMCLGIKNNVCVLIRSIVQGDGKSTFLNLLEQHVIGEKNTCIGTSRMVTSGFNYPMYNKILVRFEELPCFSREQYKGISGYFKNWITEKYINYEDKGKPSFDAFNCHTMFILSNNDCIDDDDGRRYFILDHKNIFIGDTKAKAEYFKKIYSNCFNQNVGDCFYSYLIDNVEIEDNFDPNSQMPLTKNKMVSSAQKLAKPYVFIKEKFLLTGLNIKMKLKELYTMYCDEGKYFKMSVETFNKYIVASELNKFVKTSGGYKKIELSNEQLKEIYTKNNWIGEFDEYNNDTIEKEIQDLHQDEINEYKNEIEVLKAEIVKLTNMMKENEKSKANPKKAPATQYITHKPRETRSHVVVSDDEDDDEELEFELSNNTGLTNFFK
ncbi:MAG TPA: DUF5906 domain-containing protein [Allocoleopsis sp.]